MIGGAARLVGVALVLVPASASAGAGTARPPVALTASPARVALEGAARATVRLANSGTGRVTVDVSRAGFALDLRGRPRIVAGKARGRSATRWLRVRPKRIVLAPRSSRLVTVASAVPARAEPGDHDALLLFTTHPRIRDGVAVRMRMGVVVVVRAPGTVVHRLTFGRRLGLAGAGRRRTLELPVSNAGNVTESIRRTDVTLSLFTSARRVAKVAVVSRELRPRTRGLLQFRLPARVRGALTVRLELRLDAGRTVRRTFRIRV
jgi:hypothetical protein